MKHIIWDFNGTLLNDAQLSVDLDNDVFDQIGVPRITLEDYRNNMTMPVRDFYPRVGVDYAKHSYEEIARLWLDEFNKRAVGVGPLVGGTLAHLIGIRNTFFISAAFLWFVAVLVILYIKEPKMGTVKKVESKDTTIGEDLSYAFHNGHLREILFIAFGLQTTILMIQPVTALYVSELLDGMGNVELISGFIMSSGGIAGALTTTLWGKFGQRKGYYFAICLTLLAAGCLTMSQSVPDTVVGFGLCQFLVGCFVIGVNPSLNAAMVMYTPDDFRGRVFGLFNTAQQFGNMVGPLVSSAISMMAGIWEVYAIAGLIQLSLGVKVYLGRVRKGELGK